MRKNTMLTLDEELVENAKTIGLNLSQIAEEAVREEIDEKLRPKGEEKVQIPRTKKLILDNIGPFRGKREFDFSPGINIIVGPTGSGKTTVVDSIRSAYSDHLPPTRNVDAPDEEGSYISVKPMNGEIRKKGRDRLKEGVAISREDPAIDSNSLPYHIDKEEFDEKVERYLERWSSDGTKTLSEGQKIFRETLFQVLMTRPTECYLKNHALVKLDLEHREDLLDIFKEEGVQVILTAPYLQTERDDINVIRFESYDKYKGDVD